MLALENIYVDSSHSNIDFMHAGKCINECKSFIITYAIRINNEIESHVRMTHGWMN